MTIAGFEGREARFQAHIGWRLVDAKTEAGNFDSGVVERKEISEGELGGRRGGLRVRTVVCLSLCFALFRGLELGGQRLMVRMKVSGMLGQLV